MHYFTPHAPNLTPPLKEHPPLLPAQAAWNRALLAAAHAAAGAALLLRARRTDLASPASIYACYMDVWKLFYLQYLLVPFFR